MKRLFSSIKVIEAGGRGRMHKLNSALTGNLPRPKRKSIAQEEYQTRNKRVTGTMKGAQPFMRDGVVYVETEEAARWLDAFVEAQIDPPKQIWKPPKNTLPSTKEALKKLAKY